MTSASSHQGIAQELDRARAKGPLQQISIPPCPDLLTRLRAAMSQTPPDLAEVARIAESDVAMAATLLRNANGARFASVPPVRTLGRAMDRLGLRQTADLMSGFLTRHAIPVRHPKLQRFWERSALRAAALRLVAGKLPGAAPDLAHLYGLFNHVGIPVLLQSVRGYGSTMVEAEARLDRPYIATENANHRTDHAVVGAMVARAWHLPPAVMAAIRLHHDFASFGGAGVEPEVYTLVAIGLVAEQAMRRREGLGPEVDWTQHGTAALAWLSVTEDELDEWEPELQDAMDAAGE